MVATLIYEMSHVYGVDTRPWLRRIGLKVLQICMDVNRWRIHRPMPSTVLEEFFHSLLL